MNPTDMKNYSVLKGKSTLQHICTNRLGLDNTLEEGRFLTIGIDYKTSLKKSTNFLN